jgi:hypothetical protein
MFEVINNPEEGYQEAIDMAVNLLLQNTDAQNLTKLFRRHLRIGFLMPNSLMKPERLLNQLSKTGVSCSA